MIMARKRSNIAFNLSFLDVMSCGFGAVVLVFLIIDHSVDVQAESINSDLVSEVNLLEEEVLEGEEGLVRLRNTLSDVDFKMVEARGLATRISSEIDDFQSLIESLETEGMGDPSSTDSLKDEIRQLEEEVNKLKASSESSGGNNAREFLGDGERQYLTGLNLGGNNILILLDASASMLSEELVNVIRLRNMSTARQLAAKKWSRSVATVEWLVAQLPPTSQYQLYAFNTEAQPVLTGTEGSWLNVSDREKLNRNIALLQQLTPSGGTSLENAVAAALAMAPLPDNIFLVTDGLPTQGASGPGSKRTISQRDRIKLFERAVRQLPKSIPINVVLLPMEGEPAAASLYWKLAIETSGSFMSPSRDWP